MRLLSVTLKGIYSFQNAELRCDPVVTSIIGANDVGKTNIFRAIDHFAGLVPTLDVPLSIQCQFPTEGTPEIAFEFRVDDSSEVRKLAEVIGASELPQHPFRFRTSIANASMRVEIGKQQYNWSGPAGVEILGQLLQSIFIRTRLSPLKFEVALTDLINESETLSPERYSPEARLFFSLGGLGREDLINIDRGHGEGTRRLQDAADAVTRRIREHWDQDKGVHLHFQRAGTRGNRQIEIMASDSSGAVVSLNEKGEGLRWFLALFVLLEEFPTRDHFCKLMLVDEPGVYLHPAAQSELYRLFRGLASKPNTQVIFTTHSPFLLDWARPHQVRVAHRVEDAPNRPSVILNKPYHKNDRLNFWEPFRTNIGLFLGDLGLLGEKNLLVEGASDQLILSRLGELRGGYNEVASWRILPCDNAAAMALMAQVCKAAKRPVAVLVDGDSEGLKFLNRLRKDDCADIPIYSLTEFYLEADENVNMSIEDFLSREQYLTAVNGAYTEDGPGYTEISEREIIDLDRSKSIAKHIKDIFEGRGWKFHKTDVALHIASTQMDFALDRLAGNFEVLVDRINDALKEPPEERPHAALLGKIDAVSPESSREAWWAVFSVSFKRGRGIKQMVIVPSGASGEEGWSFPKPNQQMASDTSAASAPACNSCSLVGTRIDSEDADGMQAEATELVSPGLATNTEDVFPQTPDAGPDENHLADIETHNRPEIKVFDCWEREWVANSSGPFLTGGAGLVHIGASEVLQQSSSVRIVLKYAEHIEDEIIDVYVNLGREFSIGEEIEGIAMQRVFHGWVLSIPGTARLGWAYRGYIEGGVDGIKQGARIRGRVVPPHPSRRAYINIA